MLLCQVIKDTNASNTFVAADAIPDGDRIWIAQQWENARLIQNQNPEIPHLLIIDEVQKIDNWSEQVKAEWDRYAT
jgi:predicted AAA+ superfamily ATPase